MAYRNLFRLDWIVKFVFEMTKGGKKSGEGKWGLIKMRDGKLISLAPRPVFTLELSWGRRVNRGWWKGGSYIREKGKVLRKTF